MWLSSSKISLARGTSYKVMASPDFLVVTHYDSFHLKRIFNSSTNTVSYSGLCGDILTYICMKHILTFDVEVLNVSDWGVLQDDGTWSGKYISRAWS